MHAKAEAAVEADSREDYSNTNILCFGAVALKHSDICANLYGAAPSKNTVVEKRDNPLVANQGNCTHFKPMSTKEEAETLCIGGDTSSDKSILLIGDSHAMHYFATFDIAANSLGYKLLGAIGGANTCSPIHPLVPEYTAHCDEVSDYTYNTAIKEADVIVLSIYGFRPGDIDKYLIPLQNAISKCNDIQKVPIIIQDAPMKISTNQPNFEETFGQDELLAHINPDLNYKVLKTRDLFCKDDMCYSEIGNADVYLDDNHISQTYATTLGPLITPRLKELISSGM
jgi:hypothetical protein